MTEEREQYNTALMVAQQVDGMTLMQLGEVLSKSGYFQDAKGAAQAIVKVLAGRELGIGPIASMTGIHIIQGRVSVGANVMAAKVKGSERYDFRTRELTNEQAVIDFFERDSDGKMALIGTSTFTIADAKAANTKNMGAFPRNMLFARAMSNGVKWYCPDLSVAPMYTPDELGDTVDYETGEIVDVQPEPTAEQPTGNGHDNADKPSADVPNNPKAALEYVNSRVQVPYDNLFHMLGGIRNEFENDSMSWPGAKDQHGWTVAIDAALKHANAKTNKSAAEPEAVTE